MNEKYVDANIEILRVARDITRAELVALRRLIWAYFEMRDTSANLPYLYPRKKIEKLERAIDKAEVALRKAAKEE